MARRLLGSYPSANLHDPEIYIAEVVATICKFGADVAERGIAAARKASPEFVPTCGRILEEIEAAELDRRHSEELRERWARPRLANPHAMPEVRNEATYSALCARFGIDEIPPGWDAIDVTRAAVRHGAGLRDHIAQILRRGDVAPKSAFARVVDHAREAMKSRDDAGTMAEVQQ